MKARPLRQILSAGETAVGVSCALGAPALAEMFAASGPDYLYIDQQHGQTSFDTLLSMLRAVAAFPVSPLVRVLANDAGLIGRALDAGADGVIVPMVNSRAEAERAVAACRYAPAGVRSFGPIRSGLLHGRDTVAADARVACVVMIETEDGVAAADEIASVPGIDAIYIGQADLALSLGLEPKIDIQPGRHADAIARIANACDRAGIARGINGQAERRRAEGYRMITLGSDTTLVGQAVTRIGEALAAARRAEQGGQR